MSQELKHVSAIKMKKNGKDVREIAFADIDDDYQYGKLSDLTVILMKKNGYINATKMCKRLTKNFSDWSVISHSKELIKALSLRTNIRVSELVISIKSVDNKKISGTYVHNALIPHIATWASPAFGVDVGLIVMGLTQKI